LARFSGPALKFLFPNASTRASRSSSGSPASARSAIKTSFAAASSIDAFRFFAIVITEYQHPELTQELSSSHAFSPLPTGQLFRLRLISGF
jgi:hypothetical protein